MAEHFKEVCSKCRTVVNQCRCPDPNKKVTYVICPACVKKISEGVQPSPSVDIERVKDLTRRLNGILQDPQPGHFTWHTWHEAVGNLMRELRDELDFVLADPQPRTREEERREQSRNVCDYPIL